ncbi:MAG TPA: M48 family metallopeptidase [Dehalococcoidia bacterium]|jgi:heat shock protein HtpX
MWQQIRSNRTRSIFLVIGMGLLLALLGFGIGYYFGSGTGGLVIALLVWAIMSLIGYFQGDSILLASARARKIDPNDHPRLFNVVEEMKIASGLGKMPDVYIVDDPAMNAFATGRDPKKASVAVTSGLLQNLNRDELQGVIGHEMAHVRNRDVLLMAMCAVLLGSIVMISWYASRFMMFGGMGRTRRSSSGGGGAAILIIMAIAILLMILAPIFAQLIYFALSRRREYLADASSAMYTRYPEGLASALEKIAASTEQLKSANQATAPMYIMNPFRKRGMTAQNLTSTHPPISERVRILRAMGGASYLDYDKAYQQVLNTKKVFIPEAVAAAAGSMALRHAQPETGEKLDEVERTRETNNALWNANKYRIIQCPCGTRLRLPPSYKKSEIKCPHCGRMNPV